MTFRIRKLTLKDRERIAVDAKSNSRIAAGLSRDADAIIRAYSSRDKWVVSKDNATYLFALSPIRGIGERYALHHKGRMVEVQVIDDLLVGGEVEGRLVDCDMSEEELVEMKAVGALAISAFGAFETGAGMNGLFSLQVRFR